MRKLCPNYDFEDGLDTVLEVPIPEEMFGSGHKHGITNSWLNVKSWIRPYAIGRLPSTPFSNNGTAAAIPAPNADVQLLLGVVGAPLIPLPLDSDLQSAKPTFKNQPIEASMAKYIIEQYIGAAGGEKALSSIHSMYAMGKVKMVASEFSSGGPSSKPVKVKGLKNGGGEMGGFVLWQKRPDLWSLELVLSGCKISAGSDGKVAWRQTPWHHSHASRGPPRPLRRALQGLDPKATAGLFADAVCIGEKVIGTEDCFVLKLEAKPGSLKARSTRHVEIIRHVIWGCFSQRTGLLTQLEDSHILRIKPPGFDDSVFWETTMESSIEDYRDVDGIQIAHGGTTAVSLFRFGETSERHSRTRMEESWTIEEVDFNIVGLSIDCFLPPGDLRKAEEGDVAEDGGSLPELRRRAAFVTAAIGGGGKVAAFDEQGEFSD
uniref:Uncharacterized protein n=1 Tax=Kalanchoe fedtschenkoi TaxID=63787 RepID=A0A7N1A108_KALFE